MNESTEPSMNVTLTDDLRAELEWCIADGNCGPRTRATLVALRTLLAAQQPESIDMLLFCPKCGEQHVDAPDADAHTHADGHESMWTNPPHRSHLCHACGTIWRPADVPTNGVASIQTRGKADTWDGKPEPRAEVTDAARGVRRHWNPVYNTDPVQRACAELPEGWGVNACMELGAGWVEVYGPDGEEPDFDSDADHFDWRIHEAIDFAIDAARAGGDHADQA
ncbi:hypothetical protein [Burkholderia cepacia]|uniref:hypothetical protein n=1 Tax=Burkholderia cepacia TaxID=292 RepID=UPI002653248B|nr:hypothetical protein [Burkholderia cepacia]MDN7913726.1 hypothetical protein [Burkholderia cepacia]